MPHRFATHPSHRGQLVVLDDDPRLKRYLVQVEVDFGTTENSFASATVDAPWAGTFPIHCAPALTATADHDPDDVLVEQIRAYTADVNPGVGFTLYAVAPNGTWGRYTIDCFGIGG